MDSKDKLDKLAAEVAEIESGEWWDKNWYPSPQAVPRSGESQSITIRMPKGMVTILKAFAEREKIGYQVLIKRWLDDRIRQERDKLKG